jgi:quercetin dioxygenase-like cupin family protein
MAMTEVARQTGGYLLRRDGGVIDVWWPYQPQVGRYTVKVASEQTDGRLFQLLARDRRGAAPPLHIHHNEDETFLVLAGGMSFFVGDERIEAIAGDFVFAPMNVPHAFLVKSDRAEYLSSFTPAGAERFFSEVAPRGPPASRRHRLGSPSPTSSAASRRTTGSRSWAPPPRLD